MHKNGSPIGSEILVVDDEIDIRELVSGILPTKDMRRVRLPIPMGRCRPSPIGGRILSCSMSGCREAGSMESRCSTS